MNFFQKLFGSKIENDDEKRAEEKEKNFDVLKYDGVRALRMGQYEYAIRCFRHALKIDDDLEVHDYLTQALIRNNELLPAYKELQVLATAEPDNQDIFIRMASVAFMAEDYNAMADACRRALDINADNPVVFQFYSRAYRGLGDYVNALQMVNKAIELDDKYADAYQLRGEILLEMGDTNSAGKDADWLLEHTDGNEDAYLFKARVERAKEDYQSAIAYYDKVAELNPFRVEVFRERGALKLALGDKAGAEEDGRKLLELNTEGDNSEEALEAKKKADDIKNDEKEGQD